MTAELSGHSILARIGKGLGGLSLNAVLTIVGQLATVPIALAVWGQGRYGEWIALSGLVTLLKLSDLGLQSFVVNRMCEEHVRGDRDALQRILSSAVRVQGVLVCGLFLLLGLTLLVVSPNAVFRLQETSRADATIASLFLAGELLIGIPMGVISGIYRATGRMPRGAMIGSFQQLLLLLATLGLLAMGGSFALVAAGRFLVAVGISLFILRDLRKVYPWLMLYPRLGSWAEGSRMIVPGLFFLAIPLADYLSTQVTFAILQAQFGGAEVSRWSTHRTAVNLGQMISGLLLQSVWPELTALYAGKQFDRLHSLYHSLAKLNFWLVGAVIFGMLPFLPMIYRSWTIGRLQLDPWTLLFLFVRMLAWSFWNVSAIVLYATNHQRSVVKVLFSASVLNCALASLLIPRWGISGAALAAAVSELALSAWLIPRTAAQTIGAPHFVFWSQAVLPVLIGLGFVVSIGLAAWRQFPIESFRYFVIFPTTVLLGLMLGWMTLARHERSLISKLSQRFL